LLPVLGQTLTYSRTFTVEDVQAFTRATGDVGRHHVTPDAGGRLMVHGLLTATLPTKIGGDLNYIAREMHFEFIRPVFTGDTITTEVTVAELEDEGKHLRMVATVVCRNQHGKEVMKARTNGVVLK
jgi:3-hydroxybutyryl-CoA dehydratase